MASRKAQRREMRESERGRLPILSLGATVKTESQSGGSPYAEEDAGKVRTTSTVANIIKEVKEGRQRPNPRRWLLKGTQDLGYREG